VLIPFAPDVRFKVAPPPVVALLKIVAYTEDPYRRQKDLDDLRSLLRRYEAESDRIFDDDVFAAELEDIEYANAFLVGSDVGAIATDDDAKIVHAFLTKHRFSAAELADLDPDDLQERDVFRFHTQLEAFEKGFTAGRQPASA
jgi:predicted nucleotidyltransferase